jgi:hypothetical protein
VNFSLYRRNGEWKAYGVQIDGISLVANYRTSAVEVRNGGLDGLIQSLAARNRQVPHSVGSRANGASCTGGNVSQRTLQVRPGAGSGPVESVTLT